MKIQADQIQIGDTFDAGPHSVHRKRRKAIVAIVRGQKKVSLTFEDGSGASFKSKQKVTIER